MQKLLIGLLALGTISSFSFASNEALVCEKSGEIQKAQMITLSRAQYEQNIKFNENLNEEELLKQVSERVEESSPILGQMFANLYLQVTDEANINLGNFAFPAPAQSQLYRICDNSTELPTLTTIAKQESTLKIDKVIYYKLNDLNKTSLILNEVLKRLNLTSVTKIMPYSKTSYVQTENILDQNKLDQLNSLLLSEEKSSDLTKLLESLTIGLVTKPIEVATQTIKSNYNNANSFESAQMALENQTIDLDHGVKVTLEIKQTDFEPHELAKLKKDGLPLDPGAIFWAIPGSFMITSAIGGIGNAVLVLGGASISPAVGGAMLIVGVSIGTAITAYGIIANFIYKRKVKLLQQSFNYIHGVEGKNGLLNRTYKKFKNEVSGVTKLEYAQRVIDLSYKNAFGKKSGKFVNLINMREIIIQSFQDENAHTTHD